MSKHTPGPFTRSREDILTNTICILGPENSEGWCPVLATISTNHRAEASANADLFAAAPQMLEALSGFEIRKDDEGEWLRIGTAIVHKDKFGPIVWANILATVRRAQEVIAKVEGREGV